MKINELVKNMSNNLPVKIINTWTYDTLFNGSVNGLKAIKKHTRREFVDYEWNDYRKQLVIYVSEKGE